MKRIIALWFLLFITNLLARPAIDYFVFNHIDIRYEAYVQLLVASLAQLVIVGAAFGLITSESVLVPLRTVRRPTVAGLFLWFDAVILLLTFMPGFPEWMRLNQPEGFADYYMGCKALAGGILIVWGSFSRPWTEWDRRWLMLIGVLVAAHGVDYFMPWLAALSRPFVASWALLTGWLLFYGPLFGLVLVSLTRLETIWNRHSMEAGFMVRYAAAFAVVGAAILALNVFNRPYLLEPWDSVAKACAYLSLTALLAGSILAGLPGPGKLLVDDPRDRRRAQEAFLK